MIRKSRLKKPTGDKKQKQSGTQETSEEFLVTTMDIGEVKVELDGGDSDNEISSKEVSTAAVKIKIEPDAEFSNECDTPETADQVLESTIDIGEVKIEPEEVQPLSSQFDKMETESDGDVPEETAPSNDPPALLQCEKCGRMFDQVGYKLHVVNCDGKNPPRIYKCSHCPITFTQRLKLSQHENKHEGKTPYQCREACGKGFTSLWVRNRHESKCGKDVKKCVFCDKTLDSHTRLYEHYRLEHPGERRYGCSKCDKRFKKREQLTRHAKTHEPEEVAKKFSCPECNKSFAENYNLRKHMAIHTERTRIKCERCDIGYATKESLELHKAREHPELASERARQSLARMKDRYREITSKKRQKNRALKARDSKSKKQEAVESRKDSD